MKTSRSLILILAAVMLLSGCTSTKIHLAAMSNNGEESLLTPIQLNYVQMPREERRKFFANPESRRELTSEGSLPRKVTLAWECEKASDSYTVTVSTSPNFAPKSSQVFTTSDDTLELDNLLLGTTYYWKVTTPNNESEVGSFTTSNVAPRLLRVPNVYNVRDMGGRFGVDGRRVKQNLVFRSAGLNKNAAPAYYTIDELIARDGDAVKNLKNELDDITTTMRLNARRLAHQLVSKEWIVFRPSRETFSPEDLAAINSYREIPGRVLEADGVQMKTDTDNVLRLTSLQDSKTAVLMQYIDADEDCIVPFECGGDVLWRISVNGRLLYTFWGDGNTQTEKGVFIMAIPVKKGRNLVSVTLVNSNDDFSWHFGPIKYKVTRSQILEWSFKMLNYSFRDYLQIQKIDDEGNPLYVGGAVNLTEEGRRYMLDVLGIRSDVDLRNDRECLHMTSSPLSDDVKWFHIPSQSYERIDSQAGREAFAEVFKVFLNEENYPIIFHCLAGQDRTGTVACILNGLLGVSEEEIYLDWEASGFWNKNATVNHENCLDKLIAVFDAYEGATLNERIEKFVLSLGFTPEDIQRFRDIMLEKVDD